MKLRLENFKKSWQAIQSPEFLFLFLAFWAAIIMFGGIRVGDLSGYDDAAYAHEAKVILQSGNWWTLKLNGFPDFDKPPLFIWLLAISFKVFGMTDFAAKIPGVIFGWATIITVYFLSKELFSDESEDDRRWLPVLAMFCLATTQYFLKYSSHAMTDVPFTFFFTLAIYFYLKGLKNSVFLSGSGIAVGLAMMIRSPMGFFPLVIIFLHLIYLKRFRLFFSVYFGGLLIWAVVIPASWYLVEFRIHGEVFINRHFANFLAHSAATATRTSGQQFLWYFEYLFLLIKLYLPWFPVMLCGLFLSLRRLRQGQSESTQSLLLIWLLVVLIPFSLADSKVLRYILPIFPVLSIYAAYSLKKILSPNCLSRFSQITILLLIFAGLIIVIFPKYEERAGDMKVIAPLSESLTKPDERVILYTFGELHWNYQTQLIWYGNRNCRLIKDFKEIENLLAEKKELTVIMDKSAFAEFSQQTNLPLKMIGESEKFICFRLFSSANQEK